MAELKPDLRRSAIVTLTHDPKLDDPALIAALWISRFLYRRAGQQRKTHAARLHGLVAGSARRTSRGIHGRPGSTSVRSRRRNRSLGPCAD